MARSKYTERFCAYCNKQTRMEIIGAMEGVADKTWYKCTRCRHLSLLSASGAQETAAIDLKNALPYDPASSYSIGQAIFHAEWNDVGKIKNKVRMSDGNYAMIVAFEKLGERRLIENLKADVSTSPNERHINV